MGEVAAREASVPFHLYSGFLRRVGAELRPVQDANAEGRGGWGSGRISLTGDTGQ